MTLVDELKEYAQACSRVSDGESQRLILNAVDCIEELAHEMTIDEQRIADLMTQVGEQGELIEDLYNILVLAKIQSARKDGNILLEEGIALYNKHKENT